MLLFYLKMGCVCVWVCCLLLKGIGFSFRVAIPQMIGLWPVGFKVGQAVDCERVLICLNHFSRVFGSSGKRRVFHCGAEFH